MEENRQERARQRAQVIMQVRNGSISASEGARLLGVSRKTYYGWEQKGLSALLAALTDGDAGRPSIPQEDPELRTLRERVASLEKDLETAKQAAEVRKVLELYEQARQLQQGKKNRSREKP